MVFLTHEETEDQQAEKTPEAHDWIDGEEPVPCALDKCCGEGITINRYLNALHSPSLLDNQSRSGSIIAE
jgi:hypothetical protein